MHCCNLALVSGDANYLPILALFELTCCWRSLASVLKVCSGLCTAEET